MSYDSNSKLKFIVVTSINPLTEALKKYSSMHGWKLVLVGDRKGPQQIEDDNIILLDIEKQAELGFEYHSHCPENHYVRKNIGYLYAMAQGAEIIAETDDDNIPKENWGQDIVFRSRNLEVLDNVDIFNVYSKFCEAEIWPRGFPLERVLEPSSPRSLKRNVEIGVWQFLADNEPDVDAIYRLTRNETIQFLTRPSIALDKFVYCPFNSQNTFWTPEAFPFLYLPKSVTFRFTDILRGYVAQRLLWEVGLLLGFGEASVWQDRNQHDLMHDFVDEVPMYVNLMSIVNNLSSLKLSGTPLEKQFQIYQMLFEEQVVDQSELIALRSWADDLHRYGFE